MVVGFADINPKLNELWPKRKAEHVCVCAHAYSNWTTRIRVFHATIQWESQKNIWKSKGGYTQRAHTYEPAHVPHKDRSRVSIVPEENNSTSTCYGGVGWLILFRVEVRFTCNSCPETHNTQCLEANVEDYLLRQLFRCWKLCGCWENAVVQFCWSFLYKESSLDGLYYEILTKILPWNLREIIHCN